MNVEFDGSLDDLRALMLRLRSQYGGDEWTLPSGTRLRVEERSLANPGLHCAWVVSIPLDVDGGNRRHATIEAFKQGARAAVLLEDGRRVAASGKSEILGPDRAIGRPFDELCQELQRQMRDWSSPPRRDDRAPATSERLASLDRSAVAVVDRMDEERLRASQERVVSRQRFNHKANQSYTRVDNTILDRAMPTLSGNGFKILLVALRQTIGWCDVRSPTGRKQCDAISYSQFMEKGGVSRATAARAIRECIDAGYLLRKPVGRGHVYALNADAFVSVSSGINVPTSLEPEPPSSSGLKAATCSDSEPPMALETEYTKEKSEKIYGSDSTTVLSLLKGFGLNVDQEVRALALRYSPREIEHAMSRARRQATRNPQGLLRSWLRSGDLRSPPPEEDRIEAHRRRHPELNDDARAFAAYQAEHAA